MTVLTYAASASLAAVALVYLINPNHVFDGNSSTSSASTRKKGIVGLFNPANDCFINSILQSLAGLVDLRLYLARELHRRELADPAIYASVPLLDANGKEVDGKKLASLQSGEVTRGLKVMIERLNERPIYKKTISAVDFIKVLEHAFDTHISKTQQDAQELLQIVAERLSEEYHAGREARKRARKFLQGYDSSVRLAQGGRAVSQANGDSDGDTEHTLTPAAANRQSAQPSIKIENADALTEEEDGFPLEGQTEARTECQYCHFMPKTSPTSFVMLNLIVPQKSSTTLNECFDAHFKTEYIDDYVCDKCRLEHAVEHFSSELAREKTNQQKATLDEKIGKLQKALKEDPEKAPDGVDLPDTKLAPKRKIARHIEITTFPRILVIHLSRSIFDPRSSSMKNTAKVTFPERFPVGGILNRRNYKLLGMVSHKGTHNSGHYETFRRQGLYPPISNPLTNKSSGPYNLPTISKSTLPSPSIPAQSPDLPRHRSSGPSLDANRPSSSSIYSSSASPSSHSQSPTSTRPSSGSDSGTALPPKTYPISASTDGAKERPFSKDPSSRRSSANHSKNSSAANIGLFKRRRKPVDRWWRISDDKVKECKTSEVLSMQKDVYMLFYEMERGESVRG